MKISINKTLILEKFNSIKPFLPVLRDIRQTEFKNLEDSVELQLQAERIFEIVSQMILDVCTHITAHMEFKPTNSYSDCISRLRENNILTKDLAQIIIQMVKMRNLIVHQYAKINYHILYNAIQTIEDDVEKYKDQILSWINTLDE